MYLSSKEPIVAGIIAMNGGTVGAFCISSLVLLVGIITLWRDDQRSDGSMFCGGILAFLGVGFLVVSFISWRTDVFTDRVKADLAEQGIKVDSRDIRSGGNPGAPPRVTVHSEGRSTCSVDFGVTEARPYRLTSASDRGLVYPPSKVGSLVLDACED